MKKVPLIHSWERYDTFLGQKEREGKGVKEGLNYVFGCGSKIREEGAP
jgi:hypothetical protein